MDIERYRDSIDFIKSYRSAQNAATGSKYDPNANVEHKNITTMTGEIPKGQMIGINRLLMHDELKKLYGDDVADQYLIDLKEHKIYKHDETSLFPYTYSSKEVVNVVYKGMKYLVSLEQLYDICEEQETLADEEKVVYIKYPEDMTIFDINGYTKVERLIRKKRHRNLVRVKTAFGEDLIVTDNHPLIVNEDINDTVEAVSSVGLQQFRCNSRTDFDGVTEIDAKDINADIISEDYDSCYVVQADTSCKRYTIPKEILLDEELGYLVGYIIGDGNYNFINNEITDSITITQKDKEILKTLGDIAYRKLGAVPSITYKSDKNNCYSLRLKNPMLVSLLYDEFNIGHMAKNKCLPINIYHYNRDFAIGIVEGMIDSDGTITSNKSFQIRTASRTLILQLSDVLRNLNFGVSNTTQDTKFGCNDEVMQKYQIFGVTFSEKDGTPEFNLCSKAKDSHPHDKYLKYVSNAWVNITNVDEVDNEKFLEDNEFIYDVTTTSHSFICNNIWVHNCVSITMYPYLFSGMKNIGGISEPPKNLQSFCGSFVNLIFAIASQFAGAVSTPEFLTYMDYFIRKEYGDDYYKHPTKVVDLSKKQRTIDNTICQYWQQIVYSLNQPAAARNYQSVFWNIAYFDKPYFNGIFEDFVFPDGSEPKWESVLWLQKRFMNWFNKERLRTILTFPVETVNLLDDGEDFVDKDFADFVAEMWSKGHSFFLYRSNSVDSLASCCYSKDTYVLVKDAKGAYRVTFEELEKMKFDCNGYKIFNNGRWCKGKLVKLPNRQMYRVTLTNNKEMIVTDNHRNNVFGGMKLTKDLTTSDYLMVNSTPCNTYPEADRHLTYEQGFAVGAFLGDGSFGGDVTLSNGETTVFETNFSLSESKRWMIDVIQKAIDDCGLSAQLRVDEKYNNVIPVRVSSKEFAAFIMLWTNWHRGVHAPDKEVNVDCVLQSIDFRKGIVDGWFATDGNVGYIRKSEKYASLRGYSTSKKLIDGLETICNSLGYITCINVDDRTGKVMFDGVEYNKNYPVYCLLKYAENKHGRLTRDICIFRNNSYYFRIKSIEEVDYNDSVYCFEMDDKTDDTFTLANGIHNYNCRLRNELQDNAFSYTLGAGGVATGSKCVITINFNRLVQDTIKDKNNIDWKAFDEAVRARVRQVHKYLIAYNEIVKENLKSGILPIYDAGYISMNKQFLTIGINGLVEGAEYLGYEISPRDSRYFDYCTACLKPIYEENKAARTKDLMFNTEYVPAENLGVKNAKWDKEDGYFSPRDCYNSYFYLPEDESCSVVDKLILHGKKTTQWLDGGSAAHINLQEHLSKEQYRELMRDAIKTGCSYFTFNVPNTICNDCGYISKHKYDRCPNCGSENIDYATRIIGYLKRISAFSEKRKEEAARRVYLGEEYLHGGIRVTIERLEDGET